MVVYSYIGGKAPYDGSLVEEVHHIHIALEIVYSTLAAAGLMFTLVCLIFNIYFRNARYR